MILANFHNRRLQEQYFTRVLILMQKSRLRQGGSEKRVIYNEENLPAKQDLKGKKARIQGKNGFP